MTKYPPIPFGYRKKELRPYDKDKPGTKYYGGSIKGYRQKGTFILTTTRPMPRLLIKRNREDVVKWGEHPIITKLPWKKHAK